MFVHAFGAYFGLALSRVIYREDVSQSQKGGSVYHSDLFAMIGETLSGFSLVSLFSDHTSVQHLNFLVNRRSRSAFYVGRKSSSGW